MKYRKIFPFALIGLILFAVLGGVAGYFFMDRYEQQRESYEHHLLESTTMEYESLKLAYETIAKTTYDLSINTPEVTRLMAQANGADPKIQAMVRARLYNDLSDLYRRLGQHNLRQLHFHLPGSISFLRFHRPGKFGDSLQGIRPSIDAVNRTHKPVDGFEEGRIFNGFRHVFPLFYEGKFVGTVELSYSFDAIKELASRLYPAQYEMILKQSVIDAKVFKEERSNYLPSNLGSGYLKDRHLKNLVSIFDESLVGELNAAASISPLLKLGAIEPQLIPVEWKGDGYIIALNPLVGFDQKLIGYIVRYENDPYFMELEKKNREVLWFVTLVAAVTAFFIMFFLYRIQMQKEQLKALANTDKLTGIANRMALSRQLNYLLELTLRRKEPLSCIFFDVDHFKHINDRYGHLTGDAVLIDLSRIVEERIRKSDSFGRWGGEEFVIVLPATSLEEAVGLAETLRQRIENHLFVHGDVTCSFGVVERLANENADEMLQRADEMLYEAKETGRNRVCPLLPQEG